jgi:hypothetical protein
LTTEKKQIKQKITEMIINDRTRTAMKNTGQNAQTMRRIEQLWKKDSC